MPFIDGLLDRIDNAFDRFESLMPAMIAEKESTRKRNRSQRRDSLAEDDDPFRVPGDDNPFKPHDGSVEIGGVVLPRIVADQLRQLGMSLTAFSSGDLQSAINACAVDSNLIDDPKGTNFHDELFLDNDEKDDEDDKAKPPDFDPYELNLLASSKTVMSEPDARPKSVFTDTQFRDKIRQERERERKKRSADGMEKSDDGARQLGNA